MSQSSASLSGKTFSAVVSSTQQSAPAPVTVSVACQTTLSWVEQQVTLDTVPAKPQLDVQTSTSASQTDVMPDNTSNNNAVQGAAQLSKKERKQMGRKARSLHHLEVPSSLPNSVEVRNSFEPLDMEVSPSHFVKDSRYSR